MIQHEVVQDERKEDRTIKHSLDSKVCMRATPCVQEVFVQIESVVETSVHLVVRNMKLAAATDFAPYYFVELRFVVELRSDIDSIGER